MIDMGCYEISLGDTIGIGTPGKSFFYPITFFLELTYSLLGTLT